MHPHLPAQPQRPIRAPALTSPPGEANRILACGGFRGRDASVTLHLSPSARRPAAGRNDRSHPRRSAQGNRAQNSNNTSLQ
jgi:hypothetical protein